MEFFAWVLLALLGSGDQSLDRNQIAEKLKFYKNIKHLSTTFEQSKKFADLDLELKSSGSLSLSFPHRVVWTVLKPSYLSVSLDQDQIEIRSKGEGVEKIEKFRLGEISGAGARSLEDLVDWLTMDPERLHKKYEVFVRGKNQFRFLPRSPEKNSFQELSIELNSRGHLTRLEIFEKSRDRLLIRFQEPKVTLGRP